MTPEERHQFFQSLPPDKAQALIYDWNFWARPAQRIPTDPFKVWMIKSGRGWGKTKTGQETVRQWVDQGVMRIALIGPTADDVNKVMVTGEATGQKDGLLNIFPPHQRPKHIASKRLIQFHTGAIGLLYSSEEPERLRGPQHEKFWADEMRAWSYPEENWSNLKFGLRQGSNPQGVITTTPRPFPLFKKILEDEDTILTEGSTYDNEANLSPAFLDEMRKAYEGTRLGRQELRGELLEDTPGALWTAKLIEETRVSLPAGETFLGRLQAAIKLYDLTRIVVGVDPSGSDNPDSDECGIYCAGLGSDKHGYGLWDMSLRASSDKWASEALRGYYSLDADRILAEKNFGGDMVETIIKLKTNGEVKPKLVTASKGKYVRAEPVASLFEQGRIHLVGYQPQVEAEMTGWTPDGKMKSPNRLDAMVWAFTDLMVKGGSHEGLLAWMRKDEE